MQAEQFDTFTKGLDSDVVAQWETQVILWESDHANPNPYESTQSGEL